MVTHPDDAATVRLDRATGICVLVERHGHARGEELDVEILHAA